MAASRSMLESLLARVRQRAAEPRSGAQPVIPPLPVPRLEVPASSPSASSAPAPSAVAAKPVVAATLSSSPVLETAAALEEEEVEEYDEELIEILDDGDVASESGEVAAESSEDSSPIELRASASAAELRRRSAPTTRPPAPRVSAVPAAPAVAIAVPAAVASPAAPAAAALRADVVERRPVHAGAVVQSPAPRPDARTASFVELLEASLRLG